MPRRVTLPRVRPLREVRPPDHRRHGHEAAAGEGWGTSLRDHLQAARQEINADDKQPPPGRLGQDHRGRPHGGGDPRPIPAGGPGHLVQRTQLQAGGTPGDVLNAGHARAVHPPTSDELKGPFSPEGGRHGRHRKKRHLHSKTHSTGDVDDTPRSESQNRPSRQLCSTHLARWLSLKCQTEPDATLG